MAQAFFFSFSSAEVKVLQISPNSSFVALGQPLKLNVTVTVNYVTFGQFYHQDDIYIVWSFRRFSSTSFEKLTTNRRHIYEDKVLDTYSHDSRASIVDTSTLLLVNTTLNDSGIYKCHVSSCCGKTISHDLYFNVTIEGRYFFCKFAENDINYKNVGQTAWDSEKIFGPLVKKHVPL